MCRYSGPLGCVCTKAPERPKLGPLIPFIPVIDEERRGPPGPRGTLLRLLLPWRPAIRVVENGGCSVTLQAVCRVKSCRRSPLEINCPFASRETDLDLLALMVAAPG